MEHAPKTDTYGMSGAELIAAGVPYAFTALSDGSVGICFRGIRGYFATDYHFGPSYDKAQEACDELNARRGLDKLAAINIVLSSMALRQQDTRPKP